MKQMDLKLSFFDENDANEFLRFLRYLEWCGDVGHSTSVTVHADGDGRFRMNAELKTSGPNADSPEYKNLRDLIKFDDQIFNQLKRNHRDYQAVMRPDRKDNNEFSFSMGN